MVAVPLNVSVSPVDTRSIALTKVSPSLCCPLLSTSTKTMMLLLDQLLVHDIVPLAASSSGSTGHVMTISSLVVAFARAKESVRFKSSKKASALLLCARLLLLKNAILASMLTIPIAIMSSSKVKPRVLVITHPRLD